MIEPPLNPVLTRKAVNKDNIYINIETIISTAKSVRITYVFSDIQCAN